MLRLNTLYFEYEPFAHGISNNIFDDELYMKLVDEFPNIKFLKKMTAKDETSKFNKYNLSIRSHPKEFNQYLSKSKCYLDLINYLRSTDFKIAILDILKKNNIDLGLTIKKLSKKEKIVRVMKKLTPNFLNNYIQDLDINIEFSSIPTKLGYLKPHTDGQFKYASIVIPIVSNNELDKLHSGTNFHEAKDIKKTFNYVNNTLDFNEVNLVKYIPFKKNSFLIFLKTHNSIHSVGPLSGQNENLYRNSITVNLEKKIKV